MNVLITGVNGTVGVPLAKELRARGHSVYGCDLQHHAEEVPFSVPNHYGDFPGTMHAADGQ